MYAKSGTCWGVMGDAEGFKKESEKKGLSQDLVLSLRYWVSLRGEGKG